MSKRSRSSSPKGNTPTKKAARTEKCDLASLTTAASRIKSLKKLDQLTQIDFDTYLCPPNGLLYKRAFSQALEKKPKAAPVLSELENMFHSSAAVVERMKQQPPPLRSSALLKLAPGTSILSDVMQWKLSRGHFRPGLLQKAQSNRNEDTIRKTIWFLAAEEAEKKKSVTGSSPAAAELNRFQGAWEEFSSVFSSSTSAGTRCLSNRNWELHRVTNEKEASSSSPDPFTVENQKSLLSNYSPLLLPAATGSSLPSAMSALCAVTLVPRQTLLSKKTLSSFPSAAARKDFLLLRPSTSLILAAVQSVSSNLDGFGPATATALLMHMSSRVGGADDGVTVPPSFISPLLPSTEKGKKTPPPPQPLTVDCPFMSDECMKQLGLKLDYNNSNCARVIDAVKDIQLRVWRESMTTSGIDNDGNSQSLLLHPIKLGAISEGLWAKEVLA